jgi:ribonuclease HII
MVTHPATIRQEFYDDPNRFVLDDPIIEKITDSKKVGKQFHKPLAKVIINKLAKDFTIASFSAKEIDAFGIGKLNRLLPIKLVDQFMFKPGYVIVDKIQGFHSLNYHGQAVPFYCVPNADHDYFCVSCASIVAKAVRDTFMTDHPKAKLYRFNTNAGYGTKYHIDAIREHGILDIHRRSFLKRFNLG